MKPFIDKEANKLWNILLKIVPTLNLPLIFVPNNKDMSCDGWVMRSFDIAEETFSHHISTYARSDNYGRLRHLFLCTFVEEKKFEFEVNILRETEPVKYYVGNWKLGFKDSKIERNNISRQQISMLAGYGEIAKTLVAQVHFWDAQHELKHATNALEDLRLTPEAQAVLEVNKL